MVLNYCFIQIGIPEPAVIMDLQQIWSEVLPLFIQRKNIGVALGKAQESGNENMACKVGCRNS